jgi:hypothetical protein
MNTSLTPESQAALDAQMRIQEGRSNLAESLLGRAQNEFGPEMDWNQFNPLSFGPDTQGYVSVPNASQSSTLPNARRFGQNLSNYGSVPQVGQYDPESVQRSLDTSGLQDVDPSQRYYDQAGDAIYNKFRSRMDPRFEREANLLRTQLYNSGLREGDEAYNNAMRDLRDSQNDAYEQAAYQSIIGSGAEAARMHGMDLGTRGQQFGERATGGNFANQASQQAFAQRLAGGGQQFNEGLGAADLANRIRSQQFGEDLAAGTTEFGQEMDIARMQDQQGLNRFQQELAAAQMREQQGANRFQQGMQSSAFRNQVRQQQIAEALQRRGFSLNEINAILTGQQVAMPTMPGFNTAAAAQPLQSLAAAQMTGQAAAQNASLQNSMLQGLMGGASNIIGMTNPFGWGP